VLLLDMVQQGRLKVLIDEVFPLERAGEAFGRIENRQVFGKVVVAP
jgi:NADPH:quinone reductase-like Zn-dependent oxidoreductase